MKFEVGAVVQLVSGGPLMTVEGRSNGEGKVRCVWFIQDMAQRDSFNEQTLVPDDYRAGTGARVL